MSINREEKAVLIDFIVDEMLDEKPAKYMSGHDGEWFFINEKGNAGFNFRNSTHIMHLMVQAFLKKYAASWADDYDKLRMNTNFLYTLQTSVLARKAIKDLKQKLKDDNSGLVDEKHEKELKQILVEIAYLEKRRDNLRNQLGITV